jgi:serine protease Do
MRSVMSKLALPAIVLILTISGCGIAHSAQAQSRPKVWSLERMGEGAFLGIQMEDVTAQNMSKYKLSSEVGVIVRSVEKGSPAENAKIQENDVILEYSHTPALSAVQLARLVRETPAGRKVDISLSRDGKRINVTAEIGMRRDITVTDQFGGGDENMPGPGGSEGGPYPFRMPDGRGFAFGPLPGNPADAKPRLGVSVQPLTSQMADFLVVPGKEGVLVVSVEPASAAAGKLKAGDVIVRANDHAIATPEALRSAVARAADGKMDLKVIRNKAEIDVLVTFPEEDSPGQRGHRL